jgi:hypothetical protein
MKVLFVLFLVPVFVFAQDPVITAFPSLRIAPSSRGLAMGDNGIATATANQQLYYNVAKTAFSQNFHQVSVSYLPWLSAISDGTRMMNVNYVGNVGNDAALGLSLSYLRVGNVPLRDNNGALLGMYKASEFYLGTSFALQVFDRASLGITLRTIGQNMYNVAGSSIISACGDICYYQYAELGDVARKIEWGVTVSNLGPKVGYNGAVSKTPLPGNIGLGVGYSATSDDGGSFSVSVDANKLLVDKFRTVRYSLGAEYGYGSEFFLRGGIHYENTNTGNRKYAGLGVGYKGFIADQSWGLDFYCLVPFGMVTAVSPFQNAFGFTLNLSFGNFQ